MCPLFRNLFAVSQAFFSDTEEETRVSKIWKYHNKDQTTTLQFITQMFSSYRYSYVSKWASSQCHHEKHSPSLLSLFPAHSALTTLQTPELRDLQIVLQSQRWCDLLQTAAFPADLHTNG